MSNMQFGSDVACSTSSYLEARDFRLSQSNEFFDEHQPTSSIQSQSRYDMNNLNLDDEETDYMMTAFLSYNDNVDFEESEKEVVESNDASIFYRLDFAIDNRDYYRKYELDDEYELPEPRAPSTVFDEKICDGMVTPTSHEHFRYHLHSEGNLGEVDDLCCMPAPPVPLFEVSDRKKQQNTSETVCSTSARLDEHVVDAVALQDASSATICLTIPVLDQPLSNKAAVFSDSEVFFSEEELDDEYELPEPRAPSSTPDSTAAQLRRNTYGIVSVPTRSSSPQYSSTFRYSAGGKRVIEDSEPQQNVLPIQRKKKMKKMSIGMPKRPVSAYNVFFQEERNRLYQNRIASKGASDQLRIGFKELGKIIGQKWKMLSSAERRKYEEVSQIDIDRYRAEVDECQLKRRKRIEALCDLKIPETSSFANVSPTLSSDSRTNIIPIPLEAGALNDSKKYSLPPGNRCDTEIIDLTTEVSTSLPTCSAFTSSYFTGGSMGHPENMIDPQSAHFIPVFEPVPAAFSNHVQNDLKNFDAKTTRLDGTSCAGRAYTNSGQTYRYHNETPSYNYTNYYGSCNDHAPFESRTWNNSWYHGGTHGALPYNTNHGNVSHAGFAIPPALWNERVFTKPNRCDSSIVTTSSFPMPVPVVSVGDDDDGSLCSTSTIISEGEKTAHPDRLNVLYATTLASSDNAANHLLPVNAMEIRSQGNQNMMSGRHLPFTAQSNEANAPGKKVYCSKSGRWYNVEYKCYRMKSSEAHVYLSKLNGSSMKS